MSDATDDFLEGSALANDQDEIDEYAWNNLEDDDEFWADIEAGY